MNINSYPGFCFSHSWELSLLLLVQWFSVIPLCISQRQYYIFSCFLWFNNMSQMLPVVSLDKLPLLRIVTGRCNKWSLFTRWMSKNALINDLRMLRKEKPTNEEAHFYLNLLLKTWRFSFFLWTFLPCPGDLIISHMSPNWRNEICALVAITSSRTLTDSSFILWLWGGPIRPSKPTTSMWAGLEQNRLFFRTRVPFLVTLSFFIHEKWYASSKRTLNIREESWIKMSHWEIRAVYLGMFISLRLLKRMFLFVARIVIVDNVASILFAFGCAFLESRLASSSHLSGCRNQTKPGRRSRDLWLEAAWGRGGGEQSAKRSGPAVLWWRVSPAPPSPALGPWIPFPRAVDGGWW